MVGRRIGSKVKLASFAKKVYPQFANLTGRITKREILTVGHGLAYGQRGKYRVSYRVRWGKQKRDYLMGSDVLVKA